MAARASSAAPARPTAASVAHTGASSAVAHVNTIPPAASPTAVTAAATGGGAAPSTAEKTRAAARGPATVPTGGTPAQKPPATRAPQARPVERARSMGIVRNAYHRPTRVADPRATAAVTYQAAVATAPTAGYQQVAGMRAAS